MDKSSFRAEQIIRLEDFFQTAKSRTETDELLVKISQSPIFQSATSVGISLNDDLQLPINQLVRQLRDLGKDVYLARPTKRNQLDFILWPAEINIPKSVAELNQFNDNVVNNRLDLIVAPGMAFSQKGHYRVGVGEGNFDFFLNRYQTKTVGIAYSKMLFEEPEWDISMLDVPVDEIITVG
ncbi:hypothetical protein FC62_GL000012 [Amylolactobacillus amylotrophicus DSM 20534]|uniref:Uncharacterized protein n=3 Tax=Amylolactobacillus TaxID=2767876 RepID=A0A0R1YL88_9LACO|nr:MULTISPECIES: 5-formyltetrahydrofolate cyclo-ligase [Amylolactobacillus]APT17957.1 hypothetical protein LA20533_00855 [Amylolactobacillus amylophilus DSM 20533 = JCM 1125]KRK38331.1 hypothetical protein FC62_GL000012 [Amylolactobacillus amylotrophicus DSM 20534]KRM43026.1 hypothetical protein FD40_GL000827 [Amylolactobacillus amylophilus DSM 20533 = JCM 1125]GED79895.1 5-formyltetrahydrofolate cyclo-ligase [Amylolactobacillus amylophilus]